MSTILDAKLNLGCGDKILPDYVNVDIAPTRNGRTPDVICDIRKLTPFSDGCAAEIMAIHVIEHLYRWEAPSILKEWVRVLKPGGKMILECPNLYMACKILTENPGLTAEPGTEGSRTMWVLYGNPAEKDPLMAHRWSYTPRSLAVLMAEVGLINIRQEPAQFHLREPRDMRIVGDKP